MKKLFLLRHAKSSWENNDLADFDRPLNARGLTAAPQIGEIIYKNHFQIDAIISSPAKRTKQTAILIMKIAEISGSIQYDDRIYEASPRQLLEVLSAIPDECESVMLVGHNPGIEGLIKLLTYEIQVMPTASLAEIELEIEKWSETAAGCANLSRVIRPKELED